jgi:Tfp pilus assembly protein PilF
VFRRALNLAKTGQGQVNEGVLHLNLAAALLLENRFDEVLALAEEIRTTNRPEYAANATYLCGVALSHSRSDLAGAIAHIQSAEALLGQPGREAHPAEGVVSLHQIKFELGNIFARRGDLPEAIQQYRAGLEVTRSLEDDTVVLAHILFLNNLAYHLHLLHDPSAAEYVQQGLALAQEKGILSTLPYLWSTQGEIALAQNDLLTAEQYFNEGLSLAQQFSVPERIAGLTANLGLVAHQRGQRRQARDYLSTALAQSEELNLRYLAVQIRLWLVPLLPPAKGQIYLAAARSVAEQDGYERLLAETARLEAEIK